MVMEFREPNELRWYGSRPAHKGTQILKENDAENETTIVHTVTTGKVLYLCSMILGYYAIAAGYAYGRIRDDSDETVTTVFIDTIQAGSDGKGTFASFWPPMEIPASYDIIVISSAVGLKPNLTIFGWEE